MSNLLNAIFENEALKEKVKVLLVEQGYYKEARELTESQKTININPELVIKTKAITIMQNATCNSLIEGDIICDITGDVDIIQY